MGNLKSTLGDFNTFDVNGVLVAGLVLLFACWWGYREKKKYKKLPPGPRGLPILGYLPFLSSVPFKDFDELKKKYGNVFSLYLGQSYVVVLTNYEAVKEAYTNSAALNHPDDLFGFIPDGAGIASLSGHPWMEMRKFVIKSMRDTGFGGSKWETHLQEELDDFIKLLHSFEGKPTVIVQYLALSVANNMISLLFGKRLPFCDKNLEFVTESMNKLFKQFSPTAWWNFFPNLFKLVSKFDTFSVSILRRDLLKFNNFIREEVEEQKRTYFSCCKETLVYEFLTEKMKNEGNERGKLFNESILRGNIQSIFVGASFFDSLYWLILCVAKYDDVQRKVHQELDAVLGRDGKIEYSERSKVPYTFATIMEGQRYATTVPLNTARNTSEDIKIQGFDIPKGTLIFGNFYSLHRDTNYWKEPEKFMPERYLSEDGKHINFKPESYVPFSYGPRNCLGETITFIELLSYFTALMQNFDIMPPENETISMDGRMGLAYQAFPQKLRFIPRK